MSKIFDFLLELLLEWDDIPSYEGLVPHGEPQDHTRSTEFEMQQEREHHYDRNEQERDYFQRLEEERSDYIWPDRYGWDQYA